jgi:hypothetical protein
MTPTVFVAETHAAQKRLHHTLPDTFVAFAKIHAGEVVPFGTTPQCGLWLTMDELVGSQYWPHLDHVRDDRPVGSVGQLVVIHHSHTMDHLVVLDFSASASNPSVLGLVRENAGWSVGLRFASFADFEGALCQKALAETFLQPELVTA